MQKLLTSLALVVAQALPWAGGPLFQCVGSDGSVCIDRGPEACICCEHDDVATSSCRDEHATACHDDATCSHDSHASAALTPASCDCSHELLASAPVVATTRSAVADADVQPLAWGVASLAATAATHSSATLVLQQSDVLPSAATALGLLASIVIRC